MNYTQIYTGNKVLVQYVKLVVVHIPRIIKLEKKNFKERKKNT